MRKSTNWTAAPTFAEVATRYVDEKLPSRRTTGTAYCGRIDNILLPRWGASRIDGIRPLELDSWFADLDMAPTTKAGIKSVMRQIFEYAMLAEVLPLARNPLDLIRIKGSSRRQKRPQILTPPECRRLIENIIVEPFRTMVIVALCLGLRRSELTGLKWLDFDWDNSVVQISRGVVENWVGEVKTEASEKPLPLDPALVSLLQAWRNTTPFKEEDNWVWASPLKGGSLPYYPNSIQQEYLRPAGIRAGLGDHLGWHVLRHTYRSLLDMAGSTVGVQKDLMRHSNVSMTMNTYGGALPDEQRVAQSAVTRMIIN